MNNIAPESLIFTDMDGTLLDHDTYSIEPARAMLEKLAQINIPVIPNTSKTFSELIALRQAHSLSGPFIVENGAAVYIPHGFLPQKPQGALWSDGYWCKSFASARSHWQQLIDSAAKEFAGLYKSFSQMTLQDIVDATGLDEESAKLAAKRQFGEPVLFTGDEQQKQSFIHVLQQRGANILQGGRFIHVCGNVNKGQAMQWLAETIKFQYKLQHTPRTIALGDSGNDIAMLEQADIGIRIRSPIQAPPSLSSPIGQIITSEKHGPHGWSETLGNLFNFSV